VAAPDDCAAVQGLALVALRLGKTPSAIRLFTAALERDPSNAECLSSLGLARFREGELDAAEEALRAALDQQPDHAPAHLDMSRVLERKRDLEGAVEHAREALRIRPDHEAARCHLLHLHASLCDWDEVEALAAEVQATTERELDAGRRAPLPPHIAIGEPFALETQVAVARARGRHLEHGNRWPPFEGYQPAGERLKVGYLSTAFSEDAEGLLLRGLFERHDREVVEVTCYALQPADDPVRRRIERGAEHFADLTDAGDREAACRIHADGIQVLVDLAGYATNARLEVLAQRPAPVQCHYLGYPASLGADFVPYRLTSKTAIPPELSHAVHERLVYLPAAVATEGFEVPEWIVPRRVLGLPEDGFVFAFLDAARRIDRLLFAAWMRILERVPGSVLWLRVDHPGVEERLRGHALGHGVDPERLVFFGDERLSHRWVHRQADLWLDAFSLTAGTAAVLCAWAGVPVLTVAGDTPQARRGAAQLEPAGVPDLVVDSPEAYEERAVHLATHPPELQALREALLQGRERAALFDVDRQARHLERAYRLLWEAHERGETPKVLEVA